MKQLGWGTISFAFLKPIISLALGSHVKLNDTDKLVPGRKLAAAIENTPYPPFSKGELKKERGFLPGTSYKFSCILG